MQKNKMFLKFQDNSRKHDVIVLLIKQVKKMQILKKNFFKITFLKFILQKKISTIFL